MSAGPAPHDIHRVRTDLPTRWYCRSGGLHRRAPLKHCAMWAEADQACVRRGARTRRAPAAQGRRNCDDAKDSEVSLCRLVQNVLVQRYFGYPTTKPLVLFFKLFQARELLPRHSAKKLALPTKCPLRQAVLADRFGNRRALFMQHFNLPRLRHNLFGLISFSSHR